MHLEDSAAFLSNRMLHLILMPTEQCNFRCVYCYEDFADGEMPRAVVDSVKALMRRRAADLDLLAIEWFGGEPMLALGLIEELQEFTLRLAEVNAGMRLTGSMTTNGSLLRQDRFRRLLGLGVTRYQISLDGTKEAHDCQRRRLGGGGSFDAIWRNLLAIRDVPESFRVLLRLHATAENLEELELLVDELSKEFGGDPRYRLMFKAVRHFGGPHDDAAVPVLERHGEKRTLDRLGHLASDLGLAVQQSPFAEEGVLKGCYAAATSTFVVRSNGDLAKCTVALQHPNNRVGRLRRDGTVKLDSQRMTGWIRGVLSGDPESMMCPMKGWADPTQSAEMRPPAVLTQLGSAAGPSREKQT